MKFQFDRKIFTAKNCALAIFLFFLIKGLVWLSIGGLTFWYLTKGKI